MLHVFFFSGGTFLVIASNKFIGRAVPRTPQRRWNVTEDIVIERGSCSEKDVQ
jgi:hypothetical protein